MNKSYLYFLVVSLLLVFVIKCFNCFFVIELVLFLFNVEKVVRILCFVLMFLFCCFVIIFKNFGKRIFCFFEIEKGMLLKFFKGSVVVFIIICIF